MYRYFGDKDAYSLFIDIAIWAMVFSNFLYFKSKKKAMSLFSENLIYISSTVHKSLGFVAQILLFVIETSLASLVAWGSTQFNGVFGQAFQTGGNYFGLLTVTPIFMIIFSLVLFINPAKELDIITMSLPVFLFFVKLSCFFNGCCWGIPWEYGFYNTHYAHPGRQVPVQLIEAILALLILIFLFWYRKRAKPGTMYPMYLIVYSATRFFSEFTKADYPNVLGPLKMYHLLCITGVVIGLLLMLVIKLYGDSIYAFFEKPHINLETKIAQREEKKGVEQKMQVAVQKKDRLEKTRISREKSKTKK